MYFKRSTLFPHSFSVSRLLGGAALVASMLMGALPAQFETVWVNLLDRLESASLFSEESCSFSQTDLLDSLQLWLDKAAHRLNG